MLVVMVPPDFLTAATTPGSLPWAPMLFWNTTATRW